MAENPKIVKKHRSSLSSPSLYTLKIELRPTEIQPIVWRRLEVDGRISLSKLHHFIQAAFGWTDAHLHEFRIRDLTYGIPDPDDHMYEREIKDERKAFLNRLLADEDVFTYLYDFGDDWEHIITVESVVDNLDYDPSGGAVITGGERACPPEDVGGTMGYHNFLETLLVEPNSEEALEMQEWVGGKFDPKQFDIRLANAAIMRMMYNRWGGK